MHEFCYTAGFEVHLKSLKQIVRLAFWSLALLWSGVALAQAPAPGNFQVFSGPAQADLLWSPSTGAASYNVQRSFTSGGPYTLLGNITGTTYADGAVTNGAEYYYVVSAVSNSVAGASSTEGAAIPLATRTYIIVNSLSRLALGSSNSLAVQQAYTGTNQIWRLLARGGQYFSIVNPNNNAFLAAPNSSAQLTATTAIENNNLWEFQVTNGSAYLIWNPNTGQVMDDFGNSLISGTVVGDFIYNGGTNQNWFMTPAPLPQLSGVTLTNSGPATTYTFAGQLNTGNLDTLVICSLGTNASYGISVTNLIPAPLTPTNFSFAVTDAVYDATIHGEVTVQNAAGSVSSGDLTVGSNIGSPIIASAQATNDDQVPQIYINAQINPHNLPTTVVIQFGTNTAYGLAVTNTLGAANSSQSLAATFAYPSPDRTTTLHAFITASNAAGITTSGDFTGSSLLFEKTVSSDFYSSSYVDPRSIFPVTGSAIWADLNNDGWLDLACTGQNNPTGCEGYFHWNPGTNGQVWTTIATAPNGNRAAMAVGDFDNDNRPDIFFACDAALPSFNGLRPLPTGRLGGYNGIVYGMDQEFADGGNLLNITNSNWFTNIFVQDASLAVGDFDHSGRQDVLISGNFFDSILSFDGMGSFSLLLQNNLNPTNTGYGIFASAANPAMLSINTSLPYLGGDNPVAWSGGQAVLLAGDLDNDGFPDLFALNFPIDSSSTPYAGFFHGDGNKNFTPTSRFPLYTRPSGASYIETASGVLADLNGDGCLDLVLSYGDIGGGGVNGTTLGIWLNDGHGNLTNSNIVLPQQPQLANLAVGDIFNHGRNDILLVGCIDGGSSIMQTVVLRNDGGGVFTPTVLGNFGCIGETGHGLQLADYDNDGRLDFAMTGDTDPFGNGLDAGFAAATHIFRNEMNIPSNAPPAAPPGLGTTVGNGTVKFHWGDATDDITPPSLLTYNLRVGTNSLDTSVVSPLANVTNGWRKIVAPGNCGHTTNTLYRFAPGTYYWSVQAVDGGFKGGAWAPEQTFTITNPEPAVLALGNATGSAVLASYVYGQYVLNPINFQYELGLLNASTNVLTAALNTNMWNVSWPARFKGYALQQATNLAGPWTTNTPLIGTLNGEYSVLVTNSGSATFFRLVQ